MTSLKATSTSPRRIKLLAILLIVLFGSLPLWAENYRIGVLGSDSDYCGILSDSLGIIAQVSSEDAISSMKSRLEATVHLQYLKDREQQLKKEQLSSLTTAERGVELSGPVSIEVVALSLEEGMEPFLLSGDKDAVSYLKKQNALDALIFVQSETSGTLSNVRVLLDGEEVRSAWYVSALHDYEEKALLDLFSQLYLDDEHHIYRVDVEPSSVALTVDGNPLAATYINLHDGKHIFRLDAYGFQGKTDTRELDGTEDVLSFALEPSEEHPLYVSVRPWDALVSFNGIETEGKYLEGVYAPYTLSATRDGFSMASFQTTSDKTEVAISLKPLWLENTDYMMDRKNDFYQSLFYTIASFGGYCGMQALYYIYPQETAFRPLSVVFGGISLVSLVHLVQSAADYYNSAGLGL